MYFLTQFHSLCLGSDEFRVDLDGYKISPNFKYVYCLFAKIWLSFSLHDVYMGMALFQRLGCSQLENILLFIVNNFIREYGNTRIFPVIYRKITTGNQYLLST